MLSIVIVNSDGTLHTLACLDSIFLHPPSMEFEVILVDNCSINPCFPIIEDAYPEVRLFSAPERQGFSRNYNLGIRQARGEYILILNNDTLANPGAFDRLVGEMQSHPEYGMVGPQLRSKEWKIQSVCARPLPTPWYYAAWQLLLDPGLPTGKALDTLRRWSLSRRPSGPVPCISGACMLTSRNILDMVGLLDEEYEFYFEDIEWCHRIQDHGYQVAYIADAKITHLGDQSLSKVRGQAKRAEYLSALRYYSHYYGLTNIQHWLLWMAAVLGFVMRAVAFSILEIVSRQPYHGRTYQQLIGWILRQVPFWVEVPSVKNSAVKPAKPLRLKVEEGE